MKKTKIILLLSILVLLNMGVWIQSTMARESTIGQLDLLVDLRQQIVNGYVEKPDENKMIQAAARAMVASLNDPYTVYFSPEERAEFDKQVRGSFSGIGAQIDQSEGRPRIVTPLEESPAWKAGAIAGDIILQIDGKDTQDMKLTEAISLLTGPAGTKVTLKVRHLTGEEAQLDITRATINIHTVKGVWRHKDQTWDYMLDAKHKIGYIRITQFSEHTAGDFKAALETLVKENAKGLILDLRFNPGGLLDAAVAISDMFLPAGKRIVSTKGRNVPEEVRMSTDASIMFTEPIVVLVNQGSASAAEIVSGALLDNDRAQLVGVRTFGKGSVQQVHALGMEAGTLNPDNHQSALKLTGAYYYLPNGRNIHRRPNKPTWGVDPHDGFYVPMDTKEIRKMITVRREGDVIRRQEKGHENLDITPQWLQEHFADKQLAAGFKAILGKLDTGNWPVVGLNNVQTHEMEAQLETLEKQREFLQNKLVEIQAKINKLDKPAALPGTAPKVEGAVQTNPADKKTPAKAKPAK